MTGDLLLLVSGAVLSLIFSYFPKLNAWFAAKEDGDKKLIMLALLLVVGASMYGLACANLLFDLFGLTIMCDRAGALGLVQALILAAISNQTAYRLSPQTKAVKAIKLAQDVKEVKPTIVKEVEKAVDKT
jgi:hypothetical protein